MVAIKNKVKLLPGNRPECPESTPIDRANAIRVNNRSKQHQGGVAKVHGRIRIFRHERHGVMQHLQLAAFENSRFCHFEEIDEARSSSRIASQQVHGLGDHSTRRDKVSRVFEKGSLRLGVVRLARHQMSDDRPGIE
jgi:hypothetical protein